MTPDLTNELQEATLAPNGVSDARSVAVPETERRRLALGEQAWTAFQRDWPLLSRDHYGQWVAYHAEQQLGIARTKTELYQLCLQRGLQRGEFQVFGIEHPLPDNLVVDWPVVD